MRVLVTGAAKRVGRAIALELARVGCDLDLSFRTSRNEAQATARDASAIARSADHSIDVRLHEVDLGDANAVRGFGAELLKTCNGKLAGLVHNASSYAATPLATLNEEQVLQNFRLNALAPLLLTQALAPVLRAARGAVVFFSDIHVLGRPRPHFIAYSMSKAAATDLVSTLALELAPEVRVNAIAPGVIAWPEGTKPDEIARYEARIPLGRSGTPEDAANAVRWLLLEATYVTGETIRLDGGRWLR